MEWNINGVAVGSPETGTVTQAGLYTAPDVQPADLPIVVSAEGGGLVASAAVGVLAVQTQVQDLGNVRSLAYAPPGSLHRRVDRSGRSGAGARIRGRERQPSARDRRPG